MNGRQPRNTKRSGTHPYIRTENSHPPPQGRDIPTNRRKHRNTGNTPDRSYRRWNRRTTYHHIDHSVTTQMPITTGKGNTGTRGTHPTAHTDSGTNGPPEPRQTHGSSIYLSHTGHSGGLLLGTTDCKRPAAGEELPPASLCTGARHLARADIRCGGKVQLHADLGPRRLPLVCRRCKHSGVSPSGSDVHGTMPLNSRSVHSLFAGSKSPY